MPSSDRRIAANRANALKSTGPRTDEGKEITRANALKHGLSSLVVVPGEEQGAVAARVEWLQDAMAPEGDPMTLILARQVAFLSVQAERAFRYQTAVAAERTRTAQADHDEQRKAAADQLFGYLGCEPLTNHRRLMATVEGVDVLIGHLEDLDRAARPGGPRWEQDHATRLDFATGHFPGMTPNSRAQALTDVILYDRDTGLDAAEVPGTDRAARAAWALAQLHLLIVAAIEHLRAHRPTLDPTHHAASRATAPDRAVMSFDKEAQLAQRYQFAALRLMLRADNQIRARRRDLARQASPAEQVAATVEAATMPDLPSMPTTLASFCRALEEPVRGVDASKITIGKAPVPPPIAPSSTPQRPRPAP